MQYISSFIHVRGKKNMVAVDVTKIDNITGCDNDINVYTTGSGCSLTVVMPKQKFIDMVEEKRRELWEQQNTIATLQIQLLSEIRDNTRPSDPAELVRVMRDSWFGPELIPKTQS